MVSLWGQSASSGDSPCPTRGRVTPRAIRVIHLQAPIHPASDDRLLGKCHVLLQISLYRPLTGEKCNHSAVPSANAHPQFSVLLKGSVLLRTPGLGQQQRRQWPHHVATASQQQQMPAAHSPSQSPLPPLPCPTGQAQGRARDTLSFANPPDTQFDIAAGGEHAHTTPHPQFHTHHTHTYTTQHTDTPNAHHTIQISQTPHKHTTLTYIKHTHTHSTPHTYPTQNTHHTHVHRTHHASASF